MGFKEGQNGYRRNAGGLERILQKKIMLIYKFSLTKIVFL
jgi:hypothetical protein